MIAVVAMGREKYAGGIYVSLSPALLTVEDSRRLLAEAERGAYLAG